MAVLERITSGAKRVGWKGVGRSAVALAVTVPLAACNGSDGWGIGGPGGNNVPDYSMSIDCAVNPHASAQQRVIQNKFVQIIMLSVTGQGYHEQWRVQVPPPQSDLEVTRPDGSKPGYRVSTEAVESGKPQLVSLPHGVLMVQQTAEKATQPASPEPTVSTSATASAVPAAPIVSPQLDFTLSCQAPPGPTPTASVS